MKPEQYHPRENEPAKLIDLKGSISRPGGRLLFSIFERPIEKTLSIKSLNAIYRRIHLASTADNFFQTSLDVLNVEISVSAEDLSRIPDKDPLIVVSNHPFGGLDGLILGNLLTRVRPDVRFLANYLLHMIPEFRDWLISVDPFGGQDAPKTNTQPLRQAIRWIRDGHALATFPAGEVSHLRLRQRKIMDRKWSPHIGALIRRTGAAVLPVFFHGRNSPLFHLMGVFNARMRTALLPHELVNKTNRTIDVCIGRPLNGKRLESFQTDEALIEYLRIHAYILKSRRSTRKRFSPFVFFSRVKEGEREPLIDAVDPARINSEIEALPKNQRLYTRGDFAVYVADAQQAPNLLREIGRLRELTFREVDEGTGKPIDLDRFDDYYQHLFLWNIQEHELVGAYRLGLTDDILDRFGPNGLYTTTLFKYKPKLISRLKSSIELGRSFIRPEYQKKSNCLSMLWQGIGRFIGQHYQYKILFGPVSISREYNALSKDLMIQFLRRRKLDPEFSRYVKPRKPHRGKSLKRTYKKTLPDALRNIEDVAFLLSEIESEGKGIPILLRHYLKLNASLLSFNVDKKFSDCIDGLVFVDLTKTDVKILKRFMGEDVFRRFTTHHGIVSPDKNA